MENLQTSTQLLNVPPKNTKPLSRLLLKAWRIQEAKNNLAFFAAYYFPHYCQKPFSEFHHHLFKTFQRIIDNPKGQRIAEAAPRGNAKSSDASLILPIWCIVFNKKEFTVLISDTASQAEEFLSNIRNEIETNERLIEDFGELKGEIWKADDIITRNDVRVLALGARKKIRGRRFKNKRPDLIICDDLENDENTQNPEQRKKNENWFFKAVSKAGDETTDIIVVGTIIHYDSLLSKLLCNPLYQAKKWQAVISFSQSPLWQEWEEMYLKLSEEEKKLSPNPAEQFFTSHPGMLEGTKVLWPDGQPYYQLMETRLTEGPASFDSEYQNNPINPDDCLFREEWFKYFEPNWEDYESIVGAVDPSMGKTAISDYSAIILIGKHKQGFLDVFVADITRRHPDQIIEDIISQSIALHKSFGKEIPFTAFGVESVQFQEYFKDKLTQESNQRGLYLPVEKTENQTSKKEIRIQTLQPLIKNGTVRFRKEQRLLLEQLKYYPLADHDDGPDALEMAVRKARTPQLASRTY